MGLCKTCFNHPKDAVALFPGMKERLIDLGCPFLCPACKEYHFGARAIRDIVFIWPIPFSEKFFPDGNIVRAEVANRSSDELYGRSDYGLILSCGPGYYDNKRFNHTSNLEVGTKVAYDKFVPWGDYFVGCDGKDKFVVLCGYADVKGLIE